jgi:transcriptional regulator with XRE-family HTH domain
MPRYRDADLVRAIGQRVAKARRDRGFTQEQLSEVIGIEPVTLSRLETGHRALSLTTLSRIATALEVDLGDLLDTGRELPQPELAPEEQELLRKYRAMSTGGREALLRVARELVGRAKPV